MSTTTATTVAIADIGDPAFSLGDRIAKRRHDLDLDQEDVAAYVKVSRPLVSKWERDLSVPNVKQARLLAEVLDCSFGWLCGVPTRSRCSSSFDLEAGLDEIGARGQIPGQRRLAIPIPVPA
jgi:transcriptional regulator with XRE-family HTH domain